MLDLFCVLGWSLFLSSYIASERWAYENSDQDLSHIENNILSRGLPYVFEYVFQKKKKHVGLTQFEALYVGLVCVSLPMIIIGELNYELMACSCLELDRNKFSPQVWCILSGFKTTLKTFVRFQIRILAFVSVFIWILGLLTLSDPGVSSYIVSSWLPNIIGAAFGEVLQKILLEFNPSWRCSRVLRWILYYPLCYGCFEAVVPGRWLEERLRVANAVKKASEERGPQWNERTLPDIAIEFPEEKTVELSSFERRSLFHRNKTLTLSFSLPFFSSRNSSGAASSDELAFDNDRVHIGRATTRSFSRLHQSFEDKSSEEERNLENRFLAVINDTQREKVAPLKETLESAGLGASNFMAIGVETWPGLIELALDNQPKLASNQNPLQGFVREDEKVIDSEDEIEPTEEVIEEAKYSTYELVQALLNLGQQNCDPLLPESEIPGNGGSISAVLCSIYEQLAGGDGDLSNALP